MTLCAGLPPCCALRENLGPFALTLPSSSVGAQTLLWTTRPGVQCVGTCQFCSSYRGVTVKAGVPVLQGGQLPCATVSVLMAKSAFGVTASSRIFQ